VREVGLTVEDARKAHERAQSDHESLRARVVDGDPSITPDDLRLAADAVEWCGLQVQAAEKAAIRAQRQAARGAVEALSARVRSEIPQSASAVSKALTEVITSMGSLADATRDYRSLWSGLRAERSSLASQREVVRDAGDLLDGLWRAELKSLVVEEGIPPVTAPQLELLAIACHALVVAFRSVGDLQPRESQAIEQQLRCLAGDPGIYEALERISR
jgi:hypothetical protein